MELTTIFYHTDNFCKSFEKELEIRVLTNGNNIRTKECCLTLGEVMTILIYYHRSGYKTFKDYYMRCHDIKSGFPSMPSYNRFLELQKNVLMPLAIFMKICALSNNCDGFSFIDSFPLRVSHPKRIPSHKTFQGLAKRGKTSTGWFYGFKVHIAINGRGEILDFLITPGNVADNNRAVIEKMTQNLQGKLYGDRGYLLNPTFFRELYERGVHLVTKIRSNMENKLMELNDKLMLKKRGIIESVGAILKEDLNIEHSRYRSPITFFINLLSGLLAYTFRENNPSIYKKGFIPLMA